MNNNPKSILEVGNRVPPQAPDVERSVLGAFIVAPETFYEVSHRLSVDHFWDDRHQLIFEAISDLIFENDTVDALSVEQELEDRGQLEYIGGGSFLSDISFNTDAIGNIEYHTQVLVEKYIRRQIIIRSYESIKEAYDSFNDTYDVLDNAEGRIFSLYDEDKSDDAVRVGDVLTERLDDIGERMKSDGVTGISTGLNSLDDKTAGWHNGNLVIVGARPSMGKTAFVLTCARNASRLSQFTDEKKTIAMFSLEMSKEELVERLMTMEGQVDGMRVRNGSISDEEYQKLIDASSNIYNSNIVIDDTAGLNLIQLRNKSRKLHRTENLGMIIVDYLQIMEGMGENRREQTISTISRGLKKLAKELNVPVIALSQLSRACEQRGGDKKPQLSDIRESGAIEQDADVVLFLYRPEYYGISTTPEGQPTNGLAEIIIGKQRNGPTGVVETLFVKEHGEFKDLAKGADAFFDSPDGPIIDF